MNSDIQIIDKLSDDPADCSPNDESPGDELADTVLVTVIALGVAEMVTTVLTVSVTAQVPVRVKCLSDNIVRDRMIYTIHM